MKNNDIITAAELTAIIETHGAGLVSVDGEMPYEYKDAATLDLDGSEQFRAVINYGYAVQFHLISDTKRAVVTTGLCGRCDDLLGWVV